MVARSMVYKERIEAKHDQFSIGKIAMARRSIERRVVAVHCPGNPGSRRVFPGNISDR
jgi:hypothetical protein